MVYQVIGLTSSALNHIKAKLGEKSVTSGFVKIEANLRIWAYAEVIVDDL